MLIYMYFDVLIQLHSVYMYFVAYIHVARIQNQQRISDYFM